MSTGALILPPLLLQLVRFGIIGVGATLIHVSVFSLLIGRFNAWPAAANLAGFLFAVSISFLGHEQWTFRSDSHGHPGDRRRHLIRFAVVSLFGFMLNAAIVHMVMTVLQLPYGYAAALMATLVPLALFCLNKFWAFSPATGPSPSAAAVPGPAPSLLRNPWIVIAAVALLTILPLLMTGEIMRGGDNRFHIRWQNAFAHALWGLELYPKWLGDLNGGFGSPAFFIYPPLAHFITALFYPFAPEPEAVGARLALAYVSTLALSGIFAFQWLKRATGGHDFAALIGSLLYMLAPYHVYIDVYQRGAFAECFAFIWPPLTLFALHGLTIRPKANVSVLIVSVAGLILTHVPSMLMMIPFYFAYAAMLDLRSRRVAHLTALTFSVIGAFLVSGFYLAVALDHTQLINTNALFDGKVSIYNYLVGFSIWPDTAIQKAVHIVLILNIITVLLIKILFRSREKTVDTYFLLSIVTLGLTTLLMSESGRFFWMLNTPANKIQFAWRLLALHCIAVALLSANAIATSEPRFFGRNRIKIVCGMILFAYFAANLALAAGRFHSDRTNHRELQSVDRVLASTWDAPEYQFGSREALEAAFADQRLLFVGAPTARGQIRLWTNRQIAVDIETQAPVTLAIRQFNYSGWQYRIDATGESGASRPLSDAIPVATFDLPAGTYSANFTLTGTPSESLGRILTFVGLAYSLLLVAGIDRVIKTRPRKGEEPKLA